MIYEKTNLYSISISSLQRDRLALLQGSSWRGEEGRGGGVGGIGNWKNWNLPECVWKRELWFFFFFQAYPKQRRKIIKQPRLICHKLFFRRQTSLQTRHVFFFNLHLLFSYHIHDCISKPSCYLPIKGEKRLRWLKTPMCYGLGPKTNNQCLKNVSELLRNI